MSTRPLRLGFPVKVMGDPTLKSNDTRKWRQNPHLKVSLEYIDRIFDYMAEEEARLLPLLLRPRALRHPP
jgi:UV DNA damage endonuclease